jgi:hypothetical protein
MNKKKEIKSMLMSVNETFKLTDAIRAVKRIKK